MIVYKMTCPFTGKIYVGQTIRTLEKRVRQHHYDIKKFPNIKFYQHLKKYGDENMKWEVVDESAKTRKELNDLEVFYIKKLDSANPDIGLNGTLGGYGMRPNEETRNKMKATGIANARYGKDNHASVRVICIDTGEVFDSLEDAKIKYNVNPSNIWLCCHNRRKTAGGKRWKYADKETIERPSDFYESKQFTKIRCIETGEIFDSMKEAAEKYKTWTRNLISVCQGKRHIAGGVHWEYVKSNRMKINRV